MLRNNMTKKPTIHKPSRMQITLTIFLTIVWAFLLAFAFVAAQDPPWLRKMVDMGRSDESSGVRNFADDFLRQGNYSAAIAAYRKALEINPNDPMLMTNMAVALNRSGKSDEGFRLLNQALKFASDRKEVVFFNLGEILSERGQKAEAIEYYLKSVDSEGDQDLPYLRIGKAYKDIGRLDKAREAFEKVLEIQLDPRTPYMKMIRTGLATYDKDPQLSSALKSMLARGISENDLKIYDLQFLKRINMGNKYLISTYRELANICIAQGDSNRADNYSKCAIKIEALNKSAISGQVAMSSE
jgi:tetratricopeptide (TPR) repeat protein